MAAGAPRPCVGARDGGAWLAVTVVPGARRTGADGLHDGALRVRLVAPPVEGRANAALLAWLASELRLPRRALRLARGATARRKQVEVDLPPADVERWLAVCTAPKRATLAVAASGTGHPPENAPR